MEVDGATSMLPPPTTTLTRDASPLPVMPAAGAPGQKRTASEEARDIARAASPSRATPGQGLPAPETMSALLLWEQVRQLAGRLVVYTCRARDSSAPWQSFVGQLDYVGTHYEVHLSPAYNDTPGTVPQEPEEHRQQKTVLQLGEKGGGAQEP